VHPLLPSRLDWNQQGKGANAVVAGVKDFAALFVVVVRDKDKLVPRRHDNSLPLGGHIATSFVRLTAPVGGT
jgi:hypothetical protein